MNPKSTMTNESGKQKINKIIQTLIECGFIVRMFEAVEDPSNIFYLTLELS